MGQVGGIGCLQLAAAAQMQGDGVAGPIALCSSPCGSLHPTTRALLSFSFWCSHCKRLWSSAQTVILFHVHLDHAGAWGWVRMRTFRQQCHQCWVWAEPVFSQQNARRILSDLVASIQQKCYSEDIVQPRMQEAAAPRE